MTFHLSIEMGNEEMQSGEHVARALRSLADELAIYDAPFTENDAEPLCSFQGIRDANGNTVGSWGIRLEGAR